MTGEEQDPWLTYQQAAAQAGVHVRTIGNAAKRGDLRVARLSQRLIRLRQSWLDAWLNGSGRAQITE